MDKVITMKASYYERLERENIRKARVNNRTAVVKKQRLTLLLIFVAVIVSSIIFASGRVYAKGSISENNKVYKSVMIYSGDTLETIANDNITDGYSSVDDLVKEVVMINNLGAVRELVPGNHIIVPYYN